MMFEESRQSAGCWDRLSVWLWPGKERLELISQLMMVKPAGGCEAAQRLDSRKSLSPQGRGTKMEPSGWGHQVGNGMTGGPIHWGVGVTVSKATGGGWGVGAERPWLPPSLQAPACPRASQELMPAKCQLPWDWETQPAFYVSFPSSSSSVFWKALFLKHQNFLTLTF